MDLKTKEFETRCAELHLRGVELATLQNEIKIHEAEKCANTKLREETTATLRKVELEKRQQLEKIEKLEKQKATVEKVRY